MTKFRKISKEIHSKVMKAKIAYQIPSCSSYFATCVLNSSDEKTDYDNKYEDF